MPTREKRCVMGVVDSFDIQERGCGDGKCRREFDVPGRGNSSENKSLSGKPQSRRVKNHEVGGGTGGSFLGEAGVLLPRVFANRVNALPAITGRVECGCLVTLPTPGGEE